MADSTSPDTDSKSPEATGFEPEDFEGLRKIRDMDFGTFCTRRRIKVDPDLGIDPEAPLANGLAGLYAAREVPAFFQVLAYALPVRESVWLACLAGARMLPPDAEQTPALKAAQAWVYKPTLENRAAVEKVITESDPDDPTLLAADAAFHGIAKGLEEEVKSPPSAAPTMVFAMLMRCALKDEDADAAEDNWQKLVGYGLNIAAGGTGQEAVNNEG